MSPSCSQPKLALLSFLHIHILLFDFFITFPLPSTLVSLLFPLFVVYSTWAQVSLGHCNLHNGAWTVSFVVLHTRPSRLCLLYDAAVTPFFSLLPTYLWFCDDLLSPSPHTCTSTICFQFPAPAISIVLSACIHPCVFPILSRLVVLLYMGLMLATTARVSHHLYDFAMLSYDDVPHSCLCACTLSNFVHSAS